jgi:hypothetical protein
MWKQVEGNVMTGPRQRINEIIRKAKKNIKFFSDDYLCIKVIPNKYFSVRSSAGLQE